MKTYYSCAYGDLYKGDCLEVIPLLGQKVDLVLTDPPYGTTACKWDSVIPFEDMWKVLSIVTEKDTPKVLFGSEPFSSLLRCSNLKEFKYDWVWEKQKAANFLNTKNQPLKYHETVSVFSKDTHNYFPQRYKVLELSEILCMDKNALKTLFETKDYDRFGVVDRRKNVNDMQVNKSIVGINLGRTRSKDDGFRNPKSVLKINKEINSNIHPTQKPVALLEYLIKTYSLPQRLVLDFTAGSSSTAIACINTNRKFIMIEKEEKYCEISANRIEEHINKMWGGL